MTIEELESIRGEGTLDVVFELAMPVVLVALLLLLVGLVVLGVLVGLVVLVWFRAGAGTGGTVTVAIRDKLTGLQIPTP